MTTENLEEERNMEEKKFQIKIFPFKLHISISFLCKEWKKEHILNAGMAHFYTTESLNTPRDSN